ncbi:MAG: hypothetical protein M5U25_20960 [Planctomycetota bacterium]|nr:hypothetical protein [Planctomycetota bacterium]
MDVQTHFVTTVSPAHLGHQNMLHQDVHNHLALPDGSLLRCISQDNHRPLLGQTTLLDFGLQLLDGAK